MTQLEQLCLLLCLTQVLKAVKYQRFPADSALGLEDVALASAAALASAYAPAYTAPPLLAFALALWLDTLLFRIFTIELGTGGLGTVVVSMLYRELSEITHARRFFAEHRMFAAFPIAALLTSIVPLAHGTVLEGLALAAAALLAVATPPQAPEHRSAWSPRTGAPRPGASRGQALLLASGATAAALLHHAGVTLPPVATPAFGAALGIALAARLALGVEGGFLGRSSFYRQFFGSGRLPEARGFQPRPEHRHLFSRPARVPRLGGSLGCARGANVVLVTIESMGKDHVARETGRERDARMPLLERLHETGVTSSAHFCVSPNTNNAHIALYASDHSRRSGLPNLGPLLDAGYSTIYVSPIRTRDYGLRTILDEAGFQHVLDRDGFSPGARDGGVTSDWVLADQAVEQLAGLVGDDDRPYFLHVHTTNTHLPYRVVDTDRFNRLDPTSDRGRFTNGLEETDLIITRMLEGLAARGVLERGGVAPVIVITGDHGQAFGERGYLSHASAVIAEEINVPFVMHHPELPPRRIPFSSHFDVLPAIHEVLGLELDAETYGDSLLLERDPPELVLWAGHPSRSRSSNFGLLLGGEKYMVDLIASSCWRLTWEDTLIAELEGDERRYWTLLLHRLLAERGLE